MLNAIFVQVVLMVLSVLFLLACAGSKPHFDKILYACIAFALLVLLFVNMGAFRV